MLSSQYEVPVPPKPVAFVAGGGASLRVAAARPAALLGHDPSGRFLNDTEPVPW